MPKKLQLFLANSQQARVWPCDQSTRTAKVFKKEQKSNDFELLTNPRLPKGVVSSSELPQPGTSKKKPGRKGRTT